MLKFILGTTIVLFLVWLFSETYKAWKSSKKIASLKDQLSEIENEFEVVDLKGDLKNRTEELKQHKETVLGDPTKSKESAKISKVGKGSKGKSKVSDLYNTDKPKS